jgi:hypothetical protein
MRISELGIKNLGEALSNFQEEVRNPANSAVNPQFKSKYAPLDVVINTVKPILAKNGLSFIQSTGSEGDSISVTTLLIHESGEWIESDPLTLPAYQIKGGGVKEFNAQGAGSALTYARRYSLSAFLGLSSEDDDDANGQVFGGNAGAGNKSTPAQTQPNNRDAARERAAKAQEEKAAAQAANLTKTETPEAPPATPPITGGDVVEPINAGQIKAITQMSSMVTKKRADFDKDAFLGAELAKYGVATLEELSFEQAKELLTAINGEMRKQ